jgi:hypothetical protein
MDDIEQTPWLKPFSTSCTIFFFHEFLVLIYPVLPNLLFPLPLGVYGLGERVRVRGLKEILGLSPKYPPNY